VSTPNPTVTTILDLIPAFLRAIASAPAASSFLTPQVDAILLAGAALIEHGDAAAQELAAFTAQIEAMVAAKRDPTPDEWAALEARSNTAHAIIQELGTVSGTGTAPAP